MYRSRPSPDVSATVVVGSCTQTIGRWSKPPLPTGEVP